MYGSELLNEQAESGSQNQELPISAEPSVRAPPVPCRVRELPSDLRSFSTQIHALRDSKGSDIRFSNGKGIDKNGTIPGKAKSVRVEPHGTSHGGAWLMPFMHSNVVNIPNAATIGDEE
jgi:hypothetical protein